MTGTAASPRGGLPSPGQPAQLFVQRGKQGGAAVVLYLKGRGGALAEADRLDLIDVTWGFPELPSDPGAAPDPREGTVPADVVIGYSQEPFRNETGVHQAVL